MLLVVNSLGDEHTHEHIKFLENSYIKELGMLQPAQTWFISLAIYSVGIAIEV